MELCIEREAREGCRTGTNAARPDKGRGAAVEALEASGDLGRWVGPSTVLAWVAHEVATLRWKSCEPGVPANECPACRRGLMLSLLEFGFRRRNQPVLVKVLARVFRKVIYHRFDVGGVSPRAELEEDLGRLAAEQLDILRHMERQLSFVDKGR